MKSFKPQQIWVESGGACTIVYKIIALDDAGEYVDIDYVTISNTVADVATIGRNVVLWVSGLRQRFQSANSYGELLSNDSTLYAYYNTMYFI